MADKLNHPNHYAQGDIECIDAMKSAFGKEAVKTFCYMNAFKYIWRHKEKNSPVDDLMKARIYLDKYIELCDYDDEEEPQRCCCQ